MVMIVKISPRYLAPYATVELALILINSGQIDEAGVLLETAKYDHCSWSVILDQCWWWRSWPWLWWQTVIISMRTVFVLRQKGKWAIHNLCQLSTELHCILLHCIIMTDCISGQVTKTTACRVDCILGSTQLRTSFERCKTSWNNIEKWTNTM